MKETEALKAAISALAEEVKDEIAAEEPGDLVDLLLTQREMERCRADLKVILDDLSEHAAGLMTSRLQTIAGIGRIEKVGGKDRSGWDHDALFAVALARGRDAPDRYDVDTAEMLISEGEAVLREIRLMAGTPGYWKVGELRLRGLDVEDFCVEKEARKRVKLPKDDRTEEV